MIFFAQATNGDCRSQSQLICIYRIASKSEWIWTICTRWMQSKSVSHTDRTLSISANWVANGICVCFCCCCSDLNFIHFICFALRSNRCSDDNYVPVECARHTFIAGPIDCIQPFENSHHRHHWHHFQ